jgi:rSAM/selenodomain-associated transferase 1
VKTRLARAIGAEAAAALYTALVRDLRDRLADAPFAVRWAVAEPDHGFAARFALDPATVFPQRGDDLGARLADALGRMLDAGFARCAIVGSDVPQLGRDVVERAFVALRAADVVLGPAADGGYYLVATGARHELFVGIAWSTSAVLAETLARADELGLRTAQLETLLDVDEERDLDALRELVERRAARDGLAATAAALDGIPRLRTRSRHPDRRRSKRCR